MLSLHLRCPSEEAEFLIAELWQAGTTGVSETDAGDETILLAGFPEFVEADSLLQDFAQYDPALVQEDRDWVVAVEQSWPARAVGSQLFLAPVWNRDKTPEGRVRIVHNPGLASGTGEHPCTQLALMALEECVTRATILLDVGTGSGMLAAAALRLGARQALAIDNDRAALYVARENFALNRVHALEVCGSVDCVRDRFATITVANISGTVLMDLMSDLVRVTRENGTLILTGFRRDELPAFEELFGEALISELDGWICLRTYL